jgi:hypothetical protein
MVYFQTKNPNWGKNFGTLIWKIVYFLSHLVYLRPFGNKESGHFVIFPGLVYFITTNLATLTLFCNPIFHARHCKRCCVITTLVADKASHLHMYVHMCAAGLPDFSWCMIPKPEKCTK